MHEARRRPETCDKPFAMVDERCRGAFDPAFFGRPFGKQVRKRSRSIRGSPLFLAHAHTSKARSEAPRVRALVIVGGAADGNDQRRQTDGGDFGERSRTPSAKN